VLFVWLFAQFTTQLELPLRVEQAKAGSSAPKRALTPMWDEMCKEQHLVVGGKQRPVGRMVQ
jgi:hypothetical protein